jgi:hypothetical protein
VRLVSGKNQEMSPGNRGFFVGMAKGNLLKGVSPKQPNTLVSLGSKSRLDNRVGVDAVFNPYMKHITLWKLCH